MTEPPVRPRSSVLTALLAATFAVIAAVVVGALRKQEPLAAWIGAAAVLLFLPVIDWFRRAVLIEADGLVATRFGARTRIAYRDIAAFGFRTSWAVRSGEWRWLTVLARHGERIDVSATACRPEDIDRLVGVIELRAPDAERIRPEPPPRSWRLAGVALLTVAVVAASWTVVGVGLERTLGGERLFGMGATLGIVLGLIVGLLAGRAFAPGAPIVVVSAAALCLMVAVPAGAVVYNRRGGGFQGETVPVEVLVRRSRRDAGGVVTHDVDLDIGGQLARLRPDSTLWDSLAVGDAFRACVRRGALGFPVLTSLTHPCGGAEAVPVR